MEIGRVTSLNIFQTINNTTSRIEPFHSQFLGDALNESIAEDRALFEGVWNLCAPEEWEPPRNAEIFNEFELDGARRIDILIEDKVTGRVVGIEVKTSCASARVGQLEEYLQGLRTRGFGYEEIAIAYLTPFNRARVEQIASSDRETRVDVDAVSPVRVFESFHRLFKRSRHVSWLDIADIEWVDGGEIWNQHRSYVLKTIAARSRLIGAPKRNRAFETFFSDKPMAAFQSALLPLNGVTPSDHGITIDVKEVAGNAIELASALKFLINDEASVVQNRKDDRFDPTLRKRFLESPYSEFHKTMFALSEEFNHVWLQGEKNYGLRVAHKHHSNGVSLLTSNDIDRLITARCR